MVGVRFTPSPLRSSWFFSKGRTYSNLSASVWVIAGMLFALVAFLSPTQALAQRKKITLDELVIEGNIQKPEAFFILPRTNLNLADLQRREDLRSRIIASVEKKPF